MDLPKPELTHTATVSSSTPGPEAGAEPPVFLPEELVAGRFRIVQALGAGGMGQVFEAVDLELGTAVALKVVGPQATHRKSADELFRREVQMAQQVTHPNVCRIFDLVKHDLGTQDAEWGEKGRPILALTMELLTGETLAARLQDRGPLPWPEALDLLRQIAAALDAAHAAGVCHCDLKASNVILTPQRAVVTDFGLARSAWAQDSGLDSCVRGTPKYMAPEVLEGGPPTAASDLYALGMVAHQVLTGRLPGAQEATEHPSQNPELPAAASAILSRAIHSNPAERFPDGASLVSALSEVSPADANGRGWRWPLFSAVILALLTTLALVATTEHSPGEPQDPARAHLEDARQALRKADYPAGRAAAARAVLAAQILEDPALEAEAHLLVVSAFEAMGEGARADEAMAKAVRLLEASGDRCGLARASLILRDTADTERSPLPMEELPEILEKCGDVPNQAIALAELGRMLTKTVMREGDPLLQRAKSLAEESGDARALALVWNTIGSVEYGQEDLTASEAAFGHAVDEARRAENPYLLAGMLCNRSWILGWLGRHEEEEAVLREAGALARRIGNRYLLARILATEAEQHERRGDLRQAAANLQEAHQLSLELGDAKLTGLTLERQAAFHERQGQWEEVLEVRLRLVKLREKLSLPLELAWDRLGLARTLLKLHRVEEAQALVSDLLERFPMDTDGDSTAIYARFQQVQIFLEEERLQEAAQLFREFLPYVVTKEELGLRRDAARMAVELDRLLGEPRFATLWQELARATVLRTGDTPEQAEQALQAQADLGRLLWFQGDQARAQQRFQTVVRRARKAGRTTLATQISAEQDALEHWQDYWRW